MDNQDKFLWQQVEGWAAEDPAFPALRTDDRVITYGELEELSNNLAKQFLHLGVKKGDTIVTMLPCSSEYIITMIAADKIGAIVTPMDVKFMQADLEKFVSHILPAAIISVCTVGDKNIIEVWEKVSKSLKNLSDTCFIFTGTSSFGHSFDAIIAESLSLDEDLSKAKLDQKMDDGLLIVFTGGTTGIPKAALLSKGNVAITGFAMGEVLAKYVPGRYKTIAALPPSHVGGSVECIAAALISGCEIIVHDTWSPRRVLETTHKERLPVIGGVPTMFAIMLSRPEIGQYDLSCLKVALASGEKVDLDMIRAIKDKICPSFIIGYGSTEAGAEITFTDLDASDASLADGYVGKPLRGVVIKIIDAEGNDLPIGEQGEVVVGGPLTIPGYFRMPEEDKAGFTRDGFCKTGDLGYLTPEGGLYIKGRIKHIIRVGSYTVMPKEVEDVILESGKLEMAAVIGVPDKIYGELVWAVVKPLAGCAIEEEKLIGLCASKLASFKVPKRILVWENLPITRIGKVNRAGIQNQVREMINNGEI